LPITADAHSTGLVGFKLALRRMGWAARYPCGWPPHWLRLVERVAPPRAPHFSLLVQRKVSKRNTPRHPGLATRNLIRFAHPSGQPAAVTPLRSVSSLHHCSRGRRTRAVPGPLRLSPHPCGSLPWLASLALRASLRLLLRCASFHNDSAAERGDGAPDSAMVRRRLCAVWWFAWWVSLGQPILRICISRGTSVRSKAEACACSRNRS